MSLRLFVIYLDYRLYSSILFKMEVCGLQELLLRGNPGKIFGNAVAWDGPDKRLNSAAKRLQTRFKSDLNLPERMRKL
jgi:hypothetical protein